MTRYQNDNCYYLRIIYKHESVQSGQAFYVSFSSHDFIDLTVIILTHGVRPSMRTSRAAYGIIKHRFDSGDLYLLQRNAGWGQRFNFVSGHLEKDDEGDFAVTMIREVEEELPPLKHEREFMLRALSKEPFEAIAFSLSAGVETIYTFRVFQILFLVTPLRISLLWEAQDSPNCWFSEQELRDGVGRRGEQITPFPVSHIIDFIPGGLAGLPDSFDMEKHFSRN